MPFTCIDEFLVKALEKLFPRLDNGSRFGTIIHFAAHQSAANHRLSKLA